MNRSVLYWRAASFAVAAGFIGLWQFIADQRLVSPVFLPGPDRAWASLVRGFASGDLLDKLLGTLEHMAYGWFVASIAGIALGAMIGSSRTMRSYVAPSLEFLRPLPVSAVIPVAIAMFGLTQTMALFVFGAQLGLVDAKQAKIENYVTQKALDGLFLMIAEQEKAIRKDPIGAATGMARKVFGMIGK